MRSLLLLSVLAALVAGHVATDSPGFGRGGNHPPGVGHHPPGVGRHGPAWSKWRAYKALQAWKKAITDDPEGVTETWVGPDVCSYEGVFCSPPLDPELSYLEVVSGIDLNGANLKGTLVPELGLLREIGLFHLNSNRFYGTVPESFKYMKTLFELDLSNNKLSGPFPEVTLDIPNLEYLDIRFNKFYGKLPKELFSKPLDAIFVNNNNFDGELPETFGQSNSSAIVLANNNLNGKIPESISKLSSTLEEIVALNNNFHGGLPSNIGDLENVHLFDYSDNRITGGLPSSIQNMSALETFDMSKNKLSGKVTAELCSLDNLSAVVLDDNYFTGVDPSCARLGDIISLKGNCVSGSSGQKSSATCAAFYSPPSGPTPTTPTTPTPSSPSPPVSSPPPPVLSPPPPVSSPPPPVSSPPPPVSSPPPPVLSPPPPPPAEEPSPPPAPEGECPEGYRAGRKSGKCFMLVKEPKTWNEAEFYCRNQSDGHLAAVSDWDELKDLGRMCYRSNETIYGDAINPLGLGCYLGGRRPYSISPPTKGWNYPLSPCVEFNQSFWNYGEPNNMGGYEGCLTIKYESKEQAMNPAKLPYMLNDLSCDVQLPFICALTKCEDAGCDLPETCKTMGDSDAKCYSDGSNSVGYNCGCSESYQADGSGTCIPK
ncbi:hypothetical protein KC19_4G213000 [Ceratodon purpureus]|uniref:Cell wall hydroxyproline-rich glycoprotein n=1 Tax=Ceratodon purpureus TaxID=3225 RepID=A0A8T0IDI2_CERPU|nr:hypothetical protein KC19_4G213000 [Ceratodon purpureus]